MKEPRNQFTFYRSYYDAIQALSKRDQSTLILAVCAYAIYETEPKGLSNAAFTAFNLIKPTLDSGRRKAENGSRGGSVSTSKTQANDKQTTSKPQANRKQTVSKTEAKCKQGESASEKEKEKEKEKEIEIEVEVEAEGKSLAGDCDGDHNELKLCCGSLGKGVVKLSGAQWDALLDKLGLDMFNYYVERLANYIIETGAIVHNHYETILKWWNEDRKV
jgi:hypothetical protein